MATIRIKGVPALILVIAFVGFQGFRIASARSSLDEAGNRIIPWIQGRYVSQHLHDTTLEDMTPAKVDSILWANNITFPSIKAHGPPDDMVVRVEVLMDGRPPPDGRSVQYWRMHYSSVIGWQVDYETGPVSYWLAMF